MSLPEVECRITLPDASDGEVTVAQAEVTEALSSPRRGAFDVLVSALVDPAALPGMTLDVSLGRSGGDVRRRFALLVDDVEDHGCTRDGRRLLHLRASSALAMLDRFRGTRIWYEATRAEALVELLDEASLYRTRDALTLVLDPQRRLEHLTMYNEPWGRCFQRLLEESQCFAVLDDGADAPERRDAPPEKLRIVAASRFEAAATTTRTHGGAPLVLRAHDPTLEHEAIHRVRGRHTRGLRAWEARDVDFTRPNHHEVMTARAVRNDGRGGVEQVWGEGFDVGPYHDDLQQYGLHDGASRAQAALRADHVNDLVYVGSSNVVGLSALGRVEAPTEDGDMLGFVATKVTHRFIAPEAVTLELVREALAHMRYRNDFEALPRGVAFAVPRTVPRPVAWGLHTAVVVDTTGGSDNAVATEFHGRVRVALSYDLRRSSDGQRRAPKSCWLRVSTAWAGAGRGLFLLPRVGDEVLVGYFDGDPDRPLVVGSLYNSANRWPHPLPDTAARVGLYTLSTPGNDGHSELTVGDDAGRELVTFRAQRDAQTHICNDTTATIGRDSSETVGRNASRHVEGNASTRVQGHERHEVAGNLDASVRGRHTLDVAGELAIRSETRITLSVGNVSLTLNRDRATLAVGGGAHLELRGVSQSVEVRGARGVVVTSDNTVEVQGASAVINSPGHSIREKLLQEEANGAIDDATQVDDDAKDGDKKGDDTTDAEVKEGPFASLLRWLGDVASFAPLRRALAAVLPATVADDIVATLSSVARDVVTPLLRGESPDLGTLRDDLIQGAVTAALDAVLDATGVSATLAALRSSRDATTRTQGEALGALAAEGRAVSADAAVSGVGAAAALDAGLAAQPAWNHLRDNAPEAAEEFLTGAAVAASEGPVQRWREARDADWQARYPTPDNPRGAVVSGLPPRNDITAAGASTEAIARGHRAAVAGGVRALLAGGAS